MAFTYLPLSVLGAWWSPASKRTFFWAAVWLVAAHSCLGHKEFRFVFAVAPVAAVYSGQWYISHNTHIYSHKHKSASSVIQTALICAALSVDVVRVFVFVIKTWIDQDNSVCAVHAYYGSTLTFQRQSVDCVSMCKTILFHTCMYMIKT